MAVNKSFNGTTYSIPTTAGENGWTSLTSFLQALADYAAVKTTKVQAIRVATTSPITVSATSDFAVNVALATPGVSTVTLPVGASGQMFCVIDGNGDSATNNITVQGSSSQTINGASTYVMASNKQVAIFQFNGTEWKVVAEYLGASINATKIGAGSVSNTEFGYLDGVTSAIQTQLDAKTTALANHEADTSTHGVGTVVGTSESQTLTNKTISTASNTVGPLDNISGTLSVSKGGTGLTAVGSALQVLRTNAGATAMEWASVGSGDVVGPTGPTTDNAIVRFDGTTGKVLQNSGVEIDDSGNIKMSYSSSALGRINYQAASGDKVFLLQTITSTNSYGIGVDSSNLVTFGSVSGADTWNVKAIRYDSSGAVTLGNAAKIGSSDYNGQLIVGKTNGTAIPVGYVGQTLLSKYTAYTNYSATGVWNADAFVTLTPGVWVLYGCVTHNLNGATATAFQMAVTSSATAAVALDDENYRESALPTSAFNMSSLVSGLYVSVTANTTYYLNRRAFYSAGTPRHTGILRAIRIA